MTPKSEYGDEIARIKKVFERRTLEDNDRYAPILPVNLFFRHSQERALRKALDYAGALPLGDRKVLEVGCGEGNWLRFFDGFGLESAAFSGIDLDPRRIEMARARWPRADFRVGDAGRLPFEDQRFDLVFQSTVFTSILKAEVKEVLAKEMVRVLRPNGAILWYDFRWDNPANHEVKGVKPRELKGLFPGFSIQRWRLTLAPPLARWLVPKNRLLASLLESMRFLNSHDFAVLRPEL